jgi:uncharacterized protein YbjT (DUF2867 family)
MPKTDKPNILVIWGDDIGISNLSCYSHGLMGYDSVRWALNGVDKLFLLVGNVADELTQALLTVAVARQAKVKHITYLSVYQAERFPDVPHFIGKYAVETSLKAFDTSFTVLRPGYFFQNGAQLKAVLTGAGVYPNPIGKAGIAAVDVRDIADAAVVSLTTDGHTGKTYNLRGWIDPRGRMNLELLLALA